MLKPIARRARRVPEFGTASGGGLRLEGRNPKLASEGSLLRFGCERRCSMMTEIPPALVAAQSQPGGPPKRKRRMFGPLLYGTLALAAVGVFVRLQLGGIAGVQSAWKMRQLVHRIESDPAQSIRLTEELVKMGEGTDPWVRSLLKSPDPGVRSVAASGIGGASPNSPESFDALFALIDDSDPQVASIVPGLVERYMANLGEQKLGEARRVKALNWFYAHWNRLDPLVQARLLDRFATHKAEAEPILPWLEALILSPVRNGPDLSWEIDALRRIDSRRSLALINRLVDQLADPSLADHATHALQTAWSLPDESLARIHGLLDSDHPEAQARAAWLLAKRGACDARVQAAIDRDLQDPDPDRRLDKLLEVLTIPKLAPPAWPMFESALDECNADTNKTQTTLNILRCRWPREVNGYLEHFVRFASTRTGRVKERAYTILPDLVVGTIVSPKAFEWLATDADPRARILFCRMGGRSRSFDCRTIIERLRSDSDAGVARAAGQAAERLRSEAERLLPALVRAYQDPNSALFLNENTLGTIRSMDPGAAAKLPDPRTQDPGEEAK